MKDYVFELDENGIRVYQGAALCYQAQWQSISSFLLGENDRNIIMIKLHGKKKLNINANFFEIDSEKAKLREVMVDILYFTKTDKSTGKKVWYIFESGYKIYKNPLHNK